MEDGRRPRNLLWLAAAHTAALACLAFFFRPWAPQGAEPFTWDMWGFCALGAIFVGGGASYLLLQYRCRRRLGQDEEMFGALAGRLGWRYTGTEAEIGARCARWLPGAGRAGSHAMHMHDPLRTVFETSFAGSPLPRRFSRVPLRFLYFLFGRLALLVFMFPGMVNVTCCIGPAPAVSGCVVLQEPGWLERRRGRVHSIAGAGVRTLDALEPLWKARGRGWGMTWDDGYLAVWHIGPMTPRKARHAAALFEATHRILLQTVGPAPEERTFERVRFRRVAGSFRKNPVFRVTHVPRQSRKPKRSGVAKVTR